MKRLQLQTASRFKTFSSEGAWHCKLLFDQGLNVEARDGQPNTNEKDATSQTKLKERRMRKSITSTSARSQSKPAVRAFAHSGRRKLCSIAEVRIRNVASQRLSGHRPGMSNLNDNQGCSGTIINICRVEVFLGSTRMHRPSHSRTQSHSLR